MRINWCEEHSCSYQTDYLLGCDAKHGMDYAEDPPRVGSSLSKSCRMVEAELTLVTTPAPYDIEIPDFVNRNSMGW